MLCCHLFKELECLSINWIPKIMLPFCYLRQCSGIKTVSHRLLLRWQGEGGLKREKIGPIFQVSMLWLQQNTPKMINVRASWWNFFYTIFITLKEHFWVFFLIKALSNDLNTKFTEKNNILVTDSLNTLISPQVTILSHQSQPTEP